MKHHAKKYLFPMLRWGIAIVGIWIVVSNMTLRDSVLLLDPATNTVAPAVLAHHADEDARQFAVIDPQTHQTIEVDASRLLNPAWAKRVTFRNNDGSEESAELLGMRLSGDINRDPEVEWLLVRSKGHESGTKIDPTAVVGGFKLEAPRPRVTVGMITMVEQARPWLLVLAVLVFPITFIITSIRWNKLLEAVDVHMGLARVFIINMVGAFYNSFMPGSTGGDVLKAWYASKQTPHRMRAVMSVVIDRILGLLALVMIGGVMAAYVFLQVPDLRNRTSFACFWIALGAVFIMAGCGATLALMFLPGLRHFLGLESLIARLPLQRQISSARDVMRIYKRRPVLLLWALLITVPVHVTVIASAISAGRALGLPFNAAFYFTAVPVIVLAGSIPISPQGAGVMEVTAWALAKQQGATVNQAVALTMSIRIVQIFWNLTGGIFVLRGGYHAPDAAEQRDLERPEDENESAAAAQAPKSVEPA